MSRTKIPSPREQQVLEHIARGLRNREIGEQLGIRPATVKTVIERLLEKLGARNRAEAVAVAFRRGLLPQEEESA